jgi:hypothetical protein
MKSNITDMEVSSACTAKTFQLMFFPALVSKTSETVIVKEAS